jgi:hypothetical protein
LELIGTSRGRLVDGGGVAGEVPRARAHPLVATACPAMAQGGEATGTGGTGGSGFCGEATTARKAPGKGVGEERRELGKAKILPA